MNHFFDEYDFQETMLWLEGESPVVNRTAFVRYRHQPMNFVAENSSNVTRNSNINKKMIELLKKNAAISNAKERAYGHMISERMRRHNQKKNYQALHKLLPLGTKCDKSLIIHMATKRIEELQKYKNELRRQNYGDQMRFRQQKNNNVPVFTTKGSVGEVETADIRLNVVCPNSSEVDSMLEVLKCLRSINDTRAIAIQSSFSAQKFSARFEIETMIGAAEVEKTLNATLVEVGNKYRSIPIYYTRNYL